jgi:hypothetical protein
MLNNVKVVSVDTKPAGKTKKVDLTFEHLTGKFVGQAWTKGNLIPNLDKASLDILATAKPGDQVAIELAKNEKGFYNLTKVATAQNTNKATAGNTKNSTFDNVGIKVGAARNQAIAFLSATKGKAFTLDDVDRVAYEIVIRQAAQEEAISSGNNPAEEPQKALNEETTTSMEQNLDVTDELPF